MHQSIVSYNHHEQLYKNYLTSIDDVKFTSREIDIIACLIHNRGTKKIATICYISPATVSSHVRNIMIKLKCNSKDQITYFVEKSGIRNLLKEYYSSLFIRFNFEKALNQIAKQVNKEQINCYSSKRVKLKNPELYKTIKSHLRKTNINLLESINSGSMIDLESIQEQSYYQDFFNTLLILLDSKKVNKIYLDFEESCIVIQKTLNIKSPIDIENQDFNREDFFSKKKKLIYLITSFVALFVIIILLFNEPLFITNYVNTSESQKPSQVIKDLEEFLSSSTASQFTSNNISPAQSTKNQSLIKIIEKIITSNNTKEVQRYFNRPEISSDFLMKYLHIIQALSLYYLYNEHDGEKARSILLYAKNLAEHYVNSRSKITVDFNQITDEELLVELTIVEHLPQLYTRILYALGRSYMYNNDYNELEIGRKYFEQARYLGTHFNLFESHISELHGVVPIKKRQLELLLKNPNRKESDIEYANIMLNKIITLYQNLKLNNKTYILDYDPSQVRAQQTITPSTNMHNMLCCDSNIINVYKFLIEIDNQQSTKTYIDGIIDILDNNSESPGLLQIIENVAPRKKALLYNELGDILLILNDKEYKGKNFILFLEKTMHIKGDTYLHCAEQLFDLAKTNSREIDYTKADALDGLVKVYTQYLDTNLISIKRKPDLKHKIEEYSKKRDLINKALQRKV